MAILAAVLLAGAAGVMPARGDDGFRREREAMVADQVAARGVRDRRVLDAMRAVPRHLFVPEPLMSSAYGDFALPIGEGQTISQPYIVAVMTEALAVGPGDKVLEVGAGSGYQAAVLAQMGARVFTIEIVPELARRAADTLARAGYRSVSVREGDGFRGWPGEAPFDAVIVAASAPRIPEPLLDQLREGGRLVVPLEAAAGGQVLTLAVKSGGRARTRSLLDVLFVPMTGTVRR